MTIDELTKREQPALALVPFDPIATLRFVGKDVPTVELPLPQRRFTIGSGQCDIMVPPEVSSAISRLHASLERVGNAFVVRDLGSTNGTFSTLAGPRRETFQVQPGERFWLGNLEIIATDRYLDALRAHLTCHLGILRETAINEALLDIAAGAPLLLTGAHGTGAKRLASVIHATSTRRHNPRIVGLAPMCVLNYAQAMTVFIDLEKVPPLPDRYVQALFDPAKGLRVIFAAPHERKARHCLDHYRDRLRTIELVPLSRRRKDIPHLLQFEWATELATVASVDALGPDALQALTAYEWPRNLEELIEHAPRILAYHQHAGLRPAAAALGVTHQTLSDHLARIGFPPRNQEERTWSRDERSRREQVSATRRSGAAAEARRG